MKIRLYMKDIALVAGFLALVAAPSFAVTMPNTGAASGYAIIDSSTANSEAKAAAQNAYNELLGMACTANMTDQNLNNQELAPGVYCFGTPTYVQGQILFNAKGDPNAVFVMKMASRFEAWPDSKVMLLNGARPENIFWLAGGAVTLGTSVDFAGTVVTMGPISFGRGGDAPVFDEMGIVNGRLWAVGNTVTIPSRVKVGFMAPVGNAYSMPSAVSAQPAAPSVATLTVIVNEPGFMPFVNGMAVVKGMKTPLNPGTYTVTEINTSDRDYGTPSYSGACAQNGLTGIVTINAGDSATCVITNTPVGGWAAVAAPSVSTCGGGCAPTMPNTGFGGASLPALNTLGLLLIAGLAWTERSSEKGSF